MPAQNPSGAGGPSIPSSPVSPSTSSNGETAPTPSATTTAPSSAQPNKLRANKPNEASESDRRVASATQALTVAFKKEVDKDLQIMKRMKAKISE
ncbi:hypothetical protein HDU98_010811, partial [Podochytrium sp. JEL0797]